MLVFGEYMGDEFTHKITVELDPKLNFATQEEYALWFVKIVPVFNKDKLWGFDVYLNLYNESEEEIKNTVHEILEPLISFLSFLTNIPINYSLAGVENLSEKSKVNIRTITSTARVVKPIPMPKPDSFEKMTFYDRFKLYWFKAGLTSQFLVGKITSFYKVLEIESNITSKTATPYYIKDEFRFSRNAVSHPTITDPKTKNYLMQNIGQDFIEPNNPKCIDFLQKKEKLIEEEARRILSKI